MRKPACALPLSTHLPMALTQLPLLTHGRRHARVHADPPSTHARTHARTNANDRFGALVSVLVIVHSFPSTRLAPE